MQFKVLIIWGIILILGTFLVYLFGFKRDWQELRKEHSLTPKDDNCPPKMWEKNILGKRGYVFYCLKLLFFSIFVSGAVFVIYSVQSPAYNFDSSHSIIMTVLTCLFLYSIFLDMATDREGVIDKKHTGMLRRLYYFVFMLKKSGLSTIITQEKKNVCNYIEDVIEQWHEEWVDFDDSKYGTLVLRISEDYLVRLLPNEFDLELRSTMIDLKRDIIIAYDKEDSTLVDQLARFFTKDIRYCEVNYEDIVKFIEKCKSASKRYNRQNIHNLIKQKAKEEKSLPHKTITSKSRRADIDNLEDKLEKIYIHEDISTTTS